jgi:hypothetical protein
MHWPVTSQADACTSQAYSSMYYMHCPMTSQADACSYCMGSVVLISSWLYLYLQLLWIFGWISKIGDTTIGKTALNITTLVITILSIIIKI